MMSEKYDECKNAVSEGTIIHMDERELSRRWAMSVKTLQNRRVIGGFVAFLKIGGGVRYRLIDVEEYEARNLHFSTSDGSKA